MNHSNKCFKCHCSNIIKKDITYADISELQNEISELEKNLVIINQRLTEIRNVIHTSNNNTANYVLITDEPCITVIGENDDIDLNIKPKGDGNIIIDGLRYPSSDGLFGQVLKTDGSGNLFFGDSQAQDLNNSITTFNNVPTEILRIPTVDGNGYYISGLVCAKQITGSLATDFFDFSFVYKNDGGLIALSEDSLNHSENNLFNIISSSNLDDIIINVVGISGEQVEWKINYKIIIN